MSKIKKIVFCILAVLLLTSTVYGKKKKIDAPDKLVVSFSKEGFGKPKRGFLVKKGPEEDFFWKEFDGIFKDISRKHGLIHSSDQENPDLIIKPEFTINIKENYKGNKNRWEYSVKIVLDVFSSSGDKLFTIKRDVKHVFTRHYNNDIKEYIDGYDRLANSTLVTYALKDLSGLLGKYKPEIKSIEDEFISHPQFVLAYYWKKEFPALKSDEIDNDFIIWNGYFCEKNYNSIQNPFKKIKENIQS